MYSVRVEASFSSAHNLRAYKGKCEALHGHNWKVAVVAQKEKLNTAGMVLDFTRVKKHVRAVLAKLDHTYLNKIPYFKKTNPTSEQIAKYIYDNLKRRIPGISSVTVWENDTSSATYDET